MKPQEMQAMVLTELGSPLVEQRLPVPIPAAHQVRVKVNACAVCRTDLHVVDGELDKPKLPLVPGHEVVGIIDEIGPGVTLLAKGQRVGIPWLGATCGTCVYCLESRENLCDDALFTGYTVDGGYAEYSVADERFCIPIPQPYTDIEAAPLLCAGLIGYRSLVKAGTAAKLGVYGFGAAAHIVSQIAVHRGQEIYAFTRAGDLQAQEFALQQGAVWSGDSTLPAPVELDAAIIFAPVGELVPLALAAVRKGGVVVCGGIYMTNIPEFPYENLWGERQVVSVANLTRQDGIDFMRVAPEVPVRTATEVFPLDEANKALDRLRRGEIEGAAVLACTC